MFIKVLDVSLLGLVFTFPEILRLCPLASGKPTSDVVGWIDARLCKIVLCRYSNNRKNKARGTLPDPAMFARWSD